MVPPGAEPIDVAGRATTTLGHDAHEANRLEVLERLEGHAPEQPRRQGERQRRQLSVWPSVGARPGRRRCCPPRPAGSPPHGTLEPLAQAMGQQPHQQVAGCADAEAPDEVGGPHREGLGARLRGGLREGRERGDSGEGAAADHGWHEEVRRRVGRLRGGAVNPGKTLDEKSLATGRLCEIFLNGHLQASGNEEEKLSSPT